jgi:hypothetical protein
VPRGSRLGWGFDRLLERCRDLGLVKAGGRQRTDSTHVIAAVRDLNTMELAGQAVRALVEALATVAPAFLAQTADLEQWAARYGPPVSAWRQPRTAGGLAGLGFRRRVRQTRPARISCDEPDRRPHTR